MQQHPQWFPAAYLEAEPMAELVIALAERSGSRLVMLPFDYMAEAESMGAKVTGLQDVFGLRADGKLLTEIDGLAALPRLNFQKGRLSVILQALSLVAAKGYTPCLNISGFLAVADVLLSLEKVFTGWYREKEALLAFFHRYAEDLTEFVCLGLAAGAKVISYSDPLADVAMIGPKMAKELAKSVLLPFLRQLQALPAKGVVHICGVSSSTLLTADGVELVPYSLSVPQRYQEAVIAYAESCENMDLLAWGCLNRRTTVYQLYQVQIK